MGIGKVYDTSIGFSHIEHICTDCRASLYREYEGERYWCPMAKCYVNQDRSEVCDCHIPIKSDREIIERNDCKRIEEYE